MSPHSPRPPLENELRLILNHAEGVRSADRLKLPELARALEASGLDGEGRPFADVVSDGLKARVEELVDTPEVMKNALLINFGISPEMVEYAGAKVRLVDLSSNGRREVAWLAADKSEDEYRHTRGTNLAALPRALNELCALLAPQKPEARQVSAEVETRNAAAETFDQAWSLLHRCRTCGEDRKDRLVEFAGLVGDLVGETALAEARALDELCRYEQNRRLEAYRLLQGVSLLESARAAYGADGTLHTQVSLQLMTEYVHVFLTGDRVPGGRFAYLEKLRDLATELLDRGDLGPRERARCHLALGEALKERAMVTNEAAPHKELYEESREHCMRALEIAKEISDEEENLRIVSAAKRHIAVTYEMEGDSAADDRSRNESFRQWLRYSEQGAKSAEGLDDSIHAYALMNAASAHARLASSVAGTEKGDEHLMLAEQYLDQSLDLVTGIGDVRGQGWVHIHLSDHHGCRFMLKARDDRGLDEDGKSPIDLLHGWETHANLALGHLKQLEDSMGLSIAYLELGKAMHHRRDVSEGEPASAEIHLEATTRILTRAFELTRDTGYYMATLSAARYLAICHQLQLNGAEETDPSLLVNAIEVQTAGLCEFYAGQGAVEDLRSLYRELQERLDRQIQG